MKSSLSKTKSGKYQLQNPAVEPLTVEKLLTYPGCRHYSHQEADAIVESITSLAGIFLEFHRYNTICIDNQLIVDLSQDDGNPKIAFLHPKNKAA